MSRIVLNPFGSFGDLHPFLAIAIELQRRGHKAIVATSAVYREKIEAEGVGFAPVRPDVGTLIARPDLIAKLWDRRLGTEHLIREILAPHIEGAFEDLRTACRGADLLLTHTAGFAGPIVAEILQLRWLSTALQPSVFFSAYDPPVLAPAEWLRHLQPLGQWPFRLARRYGRFETRRWLKPILELRRRLGLSNFANPLFEGQFSPQGTLALFSGHFARPQPDWPAGTITTGFIFYDKRGAGFGSRSPAALESFLAAGPAPIVFTLGSSAVMHPGTFFGESIAAAQALGQRAVLLIGDLARQQAPAPTSPSIYITDYAPYSELLPRAALTVHQGGIGTTAQALQAGRPMLIVPWAHDQPDNAERLRRLSVSLTIKRDEYRSRKVAPLTEQILNNSAYAEKARNISRQLSVENGLRNACDAIEKAAR